MRRLRSQPGLAFILATVTLDMLALGIVLPVLPRLVREMVGGDTGQAAKWVGLFGTSWAAMQFLCSPLVGALSDRFGRRPVALLSNFGQGFDYVVMAAAPNLWWLFLGRMVSGVTAASVSVGGAYIADITPREQRSRAFGLLGAAFNVGFIIGPALGGVLGNNNPRLPFWVAGALSFLNALYGYFVLPESLPKERRAAWSWRSLNPLTSFSLLSSHRVLLTLGGVALLSNIAHEVLPNVTVLYTDLRYAWNARSAGLYLAALGLVCALIQAFAVSTLVHKLGERRVLVLGLVFGAAGFAAYGLAPTGVWFCAGLPLLALCSAAHPVLQSLMTRYISDAQQGSLQGAQSSLWGVAGLIGPTLFTRLFAMAVDDPAVSVGTPYFMAAAVILASAALARWTVQHFAAVPAAMPAVDAA